MSRLDSFLRRIIAQRDCLNSAVEVISGIKGPVIELGMAVAIDGEIYQDAFLEPVEETSEVCILPAIRGGS